MAEPKDIRITTRTGEGTRQYGIVYDLISEGEIEGLVSGANSVTLDGTPITGTTESKEGGAVTTTGTISSDNGVVTVPVAALEGQTFTAGDKRYVTIHGAGKAVGSTTFTSIATSPVGGTLTANGNFFVSSGTNDMFESVGSDVSKHHRSMVVIPGKGANGSDYVSAMESMTISGSVSQTKVFLTSPIESDISASSALSFTWRAEVTAINTSTGAISFSPDAPTDVTNAKVTLSSLTEGGRNFETAFEFRNGALLQPLIQQRGGFGSTNASYIYSTPHTLLQNVNLPPTGSGYSKGLASDKIITHTAMGISNPEEIDRVKCLFECPNGLICTNNEEGDRYPSYVEIRIFFEHKYGSAADYSSELLVGRSDAAIIATPHFFNEVKSPDMESRTLHKDGFIKRETTKAFTFEAVLNTEQFQPFDNWQIRVQRVNSATPFEDDYEQHGKHKHQNACQLKSVEGMVKDPLRYPNTAVGMVAYSAQDFERPPTRGYHVRGLKVQVPTNYLTREEMLSNKASYKRHITSATEQANEQRWDGKFRGDLNTASANNKEKVYCNNPAWVFYDLCTNPTYGLGSVLDSSLIDKYALYQIARYCDELVDDGEGGLEPRFTCNLYLSAPESAYKVLKDLATNFRALLFWLNGQVTPVQDSYKEPLYTFTSGNVVDGLFEYESTSKRLRANQIRVTWNDPKQNFAQAVELVEDTDDIIRNNRFIPEDVVAFGCTSKGQARRYGAWKYLTNRYEDEIVKFKTSEAGAFLLPGDIVNIQDQERYGLKYSGRISATGTLSTTQVPLDRTISFYTNSTYKLTCFFEAGGAYLAQDKATINSVNYVRGDHITQAYLTQDSGNSTSLTAITTEALAADALDQPYSNAGSERLMLEWSEYGHLETRTVDISGDTTASALTVTAAFTEAPERETIWSLESDEKDNDESGLIYKPEQYRIMSIAQDDSDSTFEIGALLYWSDKFELVDKGFSISTLREIPQPRPAIEDDVPAPDDFTLDFIPVSLFGDTNVDLDSTGVTGEYQGHLTWNSPKKWAPDYGTTIAV